MSNNCTWTGFILHEVVVYNFGWLYSLTYVVIVEQHICPFLKVWKFMVIIKMFVVHTYSVENVSDFEA